MEKNNTFKGYLSITDLNDDWTEEQVNKFRHFAEENGKLFYFTPISQAEAWRESYRASENRAHTCGRS